MKTHPMSIRTAGLLLALAGTCHMRGQSCSAQEKQDLSLKGHTKAVICVAYSPDGKALASGCADKTIKLWDAKAGKERATLKGHTDMVWSVAFSLDGKTLASGSTDKTVKLWDVKTAKEQTTLTGHTAGVSSVAFSTDGKSLPRKDIHSTL